MPSPFRTFGEGQVRLVGPILTFPDIADAAFNPMRRYSGSSAAVTVQLLEMVAVVAEGVQRPEDR